MRTVAMGAFWLALLIGAISITISSGLDPHRDYHDEGSTAEPTWY